jgi:uncharacterized membrane protein AbrB (regulator of aidB expression)
MQLLPGSAKRKFRRGASNHQIPRRRFRAAKSIAMASLFGAIGGALFFVLHIPLPWTLGSLASAALISGLGDGRWLMPRAAWRR